MLQVPERQSANIAASVQHGPHSTNQPVSHTINGVVSANWVEERAFLRATQLLIVKVKFAVKNAVSCRRRLLAYGDFDCELDFDSQDWSCSKFVGAALLVRAAYNDSEREFDLDSHEWSCSLRNPTRPSQVKLPSNSPYGRVFDSHGWSCCDDDKSASQKSSRTETVSGQKCARAQNVPLVWRWCTICVSEHVRWTLFRLIWNARRTKYPEKTSSLGYDS